MQGLPIFNDVRSAEQSGAGGKLVSASREASGHRDPGNGRKVVLFRRDIGIVTAGL